MASISPNNLCKCWKKPARNSDIFHHRWQLVYNLQRPILLHVPYLDQRSLSGTISFIKKFKFEIK